MSDTIEFGKNEVLRLTAAGDRVEVVQSRHSDVDGALNVTLLNAEREAVGLAYRLNRVASFNAQQAQDGEPVLTDAEATAIDNAIGMLNTLGVLFHNRLLAAKPVKVSIL